MRHVLLLGALLVAALVAGCMGGNGSPEEAGDGNGGDGTPAAGQGGEAPDMDAPNPFGANKGAGGGAANDTASDDEESAPTTEA